MHYLTKYYKNLSEELQKEFNLLEAKFQKVMRTGIKNPALLKRAELHYQHKANEAQKAAQAVEDQGIPEDAENSMDAASRASLLKMNLDQIVAHITGMAKPRKKK